MKPKKRPAACLPRILPAAAKPKHFTVEQIRAAVLAASCQNPGKYSDLNSGDPSSDIKIGEPHANQ